MDSGLTVRRSVTSDFIAARSDKSQSFHHRTDDRIREDICSKSGIDAYGIMREKGSRLSSTHSTGGNEG
jgi:hypothetical protein